MTKRILLLYVVPAAMTFALFGMINFAPLADGEVWRAYYVFFTLALAFYALSLSLLVVGGFELEPPTNDPRTFAIRPRRS